MFGTATLERMDASAIRPADEDGPPLHERAKKVLGYNHARLLTELVTLGVTPFSHKSVETYKARQIRRNIRLKATVRTRLSALGLVTSGVLLFVFAWGAVTVIGLGSAIAMGILAALCLIAGGICARVLWDELMNNYGLFLRKPYWQLTPIADHDEEIPIAVIELATMVKTAIPEADIFVEELRLSDTVLLDPFLVVRLGRRMYRLAVWDEPGFGQKPMEV